MDAEKERKLQRVTKFTRGGRKEETVGTVKVTGNEEETKRKMEKERWKITRDAVKGERGGEER